MSIRTLRYSPSGSNAWRLARNFCRIVSSGENDSSCAKLLDVLRTSFFTCATYSSSVANLPAPVFLRKADRLMFFSDPKGISVSDSSFLRSSSKGSSETRRALSFISTSLSPSISPGSCT